MASQERVHALARHLCAASTTSGTDATVPPRRFTDAQRRDLYRDGFVVIRGAVPARVWQRAKQVIDAAIPAGEDNLLNPAGLVTHPAVTGLFNDSALKPLLEREIGALPPVISSQVAVRRPGYERAAKPMPHVDGSWSGALPARAEDIDLERGRPRDAARWFGANDDKRGLNDGQLWMDRGRTRSIGGFTCLVGVALSDQSQPGPHGQFGVLKGAHHLVRRHLRRQRDSGGVVGPEGIGWPRIRIGADGRPFCNGIPDAVREAAYSGMVDRDNAGWPWPEVTPVRLRAGDAVIAVHGLPHCATPNLGESDRASVYFRLRRLRPLNPHEGSRALGHGVSDHCDIAYYGKQLEYPSGYDPFAVSLKKLCDPWSEWDGMQQWLAARESESEGEADDAEQ